jgi:hypothetical protein
LGFDRAVTKHVEKIKKTIDDGTVDPKFSFAELEEELASKTPSTPKEQLEHAQEEAMVAQAKCEVLEAELARANMERMVDWEQNSDSPVSINPTLKRAVGMDVHQELPSFVNPNKFFTSTPQPPKKKKKKKDGKEMKPRHENVNDPPIFTPSSLSDADVQRRTGFPTMNHLLSYIFIICNGETDVILERWTDIYGPCEKYCRRAIALKYNIERRARNSWPKYASFKEDVKSKYYAENCFKGGVFTQLCGWIGTAYLWTGAVSDTDFHQHL